MFNLSGEMLSGGLGTVVMLLIGVFVFKNMRPDRGTSKKQGGPHPLGTLEKAAHTAQSEATEIRKAREARDDQAHEEIMDRPTTDDAVADLESRLGKGPDSPD